MEIISFSLALIIIAINRKVGGQLANITEDSAIHTTESSQNLTGNQLSITYDEIYEQLKGLKATLYNNITAIDKNEIFPPRGSKIDTSTYFWGIKTDVYMYAYPRRIVKMDVEEQALTLIVEELYIWQDDNLIWEHTDWFTKYNILLMDLNASNTWVPPIYANQIIGKTRIMDPETVTVYFDGECISFRTMQYTMPCEVNIKDFPFDTHICSMEYSQRVGHYRMNLKLSEYGNSSRVTDHIFTQKYAHLEWHGESFNFTVMYDNLLLSITLQRQSYFYAIVLIFPTVLLNILSLVVFTLPIDNTERENFSLTLTLTYFVLVMIIVDTSPPTGNQIPKLGLYVIMCTVLVVITFGMSLLLIELHEHMRAKQRKMPRKLFWLLQKLCCFERSFHQYKRATSKRYSVNNRAKENDKDLLDKNDNSADERQEEFKWKLLANRLNYVFLAITLMAHILLPCLIYLV